ncbi:MAG TPA: hypothetical protein VM511_09365 [Luteolibacter sp.]|nr:hypothetical protein [Luteolibacter sp.]
MKSTALNLSLVLPLLFASCKQETKETAAAPTTTIPLDGYFTSTAPANPQPIHLVRTTSKPGDTVTVSGLVMGRETPFVDGRAAFVLGDPTKITSCDKMPGEDHCKTPWDACCDTPEAKKENTATIQIVGADNRVVKQSIKGQKGLKELSAVTLTGTVDKASTPEALIINATAMHVGE